MESAPMNHLADEKSPYLLQHASNPVDWYPWGPAAIEKARREEKPIVLSIGYSTCHWCHVMADESFSDPEVGRIMNDHFVSIKVDREERPDLDKIYITAAQVIAGTSGWPLNLFLTPGLTPFYGGSYFPVEERQGMVSWTQALTLVAQAWDDPEKRKKLEKGAAEVTSVLDNHYRWEKGGIIPETADLLHRGYRELSRSFDETHAGFGSRPKFPTPLLQTFLFEYPRHAGSLEKRAENARRMALSTLEKMARGGIFDHVGGGFHRYATDAAWRVPHFEKMLYDNALLIVNYLDAFRITEDPLFSRVAQETADYILTGLRDPGGGFHCGEDADTVSKDTGKKVEGGYYVWTKGEIEKIVGEGVPLDLFSFRYGIREGGNTLEDPHGFFAGKNILHMEHSIGETAEKFGMERAEAEKSLEASKARLRAARPERSTLHRDDKVITAWNGLAISALARASQVLGDEKYLAGARDAARFIRENLQDGPGGPLFRRWRDGERGVPAMSDDYALLIQGLIDLYEADFDRAWIDWAKELAGDALLRFHDGESGGFFMTGEGEEDLILRIKDETDDAMPSGNAVMVLSLMRLFSHTGEARFDEAAKETVAAIAPRMEKNPPHYPLTLVALGRRIAPPPKVTVRGRTGDPETLALVRAARRPFRPGMAISFEPLPEGPGPEALLTRSGEDPVGFTDPVELERAIAGDDRPGETH